MEIFIYRACKIDHNFNLSYRRQILSQLYNLCREELWVQVLVSSAKKTILSLKFFKQAEMWLIRIGLFILVKSTCKRDYSI